MNPDSFQCFVSHKKHCFENNTRIFEKRKHFFQKKVFI